jgi:hypothetical protein
MLKLPDPGTVNYMKSALGEMLEEKRASLVKKQSQLEKIVNPPEGTEPAEPSAALVKEALAFYYQGVTSTIQNLDSARNQAQKWLLEVEAEVATRLTA